MTAIAEGDRVRLHYTVTFEDGTELDTSRGREPLDFKAGSNDLIEGVSKAVIGMSAGDKKTITVPPALAYGERRDEFVIRVPRDQIPAEAKVGAVLGLNAQGQQLSAVLVDFEDENAVLDGNHPLAGKTLVFDIEIVSVG